MTAKNKEREENFDEMKCIARNQFVCSLSVHTSIMHINTQIKSMNGMVFSVLLLLHLYICPQKSVHPIFNDEFEIQSKYHKILAQQYRRKNSEKKLFLHVQMYVCDCANWYRKTNGNHNTVILSLALPFIDADCVTHLRDKKKLEATNSNYFAILNETHTFTNFQR